MTNDSVNLDTELLPFVFDCPGEIPALKHPLLVCVPYFPGINAHLNGVFRKKKQLVQNAKLHGDYFRYVWLHERPYRLRAFLECAPDIRNPEKYWRILMEIYRDSENIFEEIEAWETIFQNTPPAAPSWIMDAEERSVYTSLVSRRTVVAWRGFANPGTPNGLSWTLDREKAIWYAKRFRLPKPCLLEAELPTELILCYLGKRGESELVVKRRLNLDAVKHCLHHI